VYHRIIVGFALALLFSGCQRGYLPADELEDDERGPSACVERCNQFGMYMSAFVLVDHETAGCVCSPEQPGAAARTEVGATGAAAAYAMLKAQRESQSSPPAQPASH